MSVIYAANVKTARMQSVADAIGATGKLEIMTSGAVVLATIPLANPAGTVSGNILTLTTPVSDTSADSSGIATQARVRTGANSDVVTGLTVGTSSADIIIDATNIVTGQTVRINSATITHAA